MFLLLLCFSLHGFATITLFETLYARRRILNLIVDLPESQYGIYTLSLSATGDAFSFILSRIKRWDVEA